MIFSTVKRTLYIPGMTRPAVIEVGRWPGQSRPPSLHAYFMFLTFSSK